MKHLPFNGTGLNPFNIDKQAGNWISGFANEDMDGTFPHAGWQNIIQLDTYHFKTQLSFNTVPSNSIDLYLRNKWTNDTDWHNWNKIITNHDLITKEILWTDIITQNGKYKIVTNDITRLASRKYLPYVTDGNAGDAWIVDATKYDDNLIGLVAVQVNASKRGGFGRLDLRTKDIVWTKFEQ